MVVCVIARVAAAATLDPRFGSDGVATVPLATTTTQCYAAAALADGGVLLAGGFVVYLVAPRNQEKVWKSVEVPS